MDFCAREFQALAKEAEHGKSERNQVFVFYGPRPTETTCGMVWRRGFDCQKCATAREVGMRLRPIHKTLDKWFSLYIRKRDMPGPCCTCGKWVEFEESDCCHFITRDRIATRWNEKNAHGGCRKCNRFESGRQYEHGLHVDKVHGSGTAEMLLWKSKHPANFTDEEIKAMSKRYREIVKTGAF